MRIVDDAATMALRQRDSGDPFNGARRCAALVDADGEHVRAMTEYVPELLNELTRIVITTRNESPSSTVYDGVVLPEWRACEELRASIKQDQQNVPTLDQMRTVYRSVLVMLAAKQVPPDEIDRRIDEVFARCRDGAYPVDRAVLEEGLREEVDATLATRSAAPSIA